MKLSLGPFPGPVLGPGDLIVHLPGGDLTIDAGTLAVIQKAAAVLAIVVISFVVMRLAHVFVRGTAAALLNREKREGTAPELTLVEIKKRQDTIETLAINVVRLFVGVIAGLMILETGFGLDIGPAIAGLGIVGIAVGLGTQHLVRDYMNGVLILIENQYGRGDVVRVAGVTGSVEDFTLRRTTLRDADGVVHTVPNGEVSVASNLTRVFANINLDVRLVYGTSVPRATETIDGVGRGMAEDAAWSSPNPGGPARHRCLRLRRLRADAPGHGQGPGGGAVERRRRAARAAAGRFRRGGHRDGELTRRSAPGPRAGRETVAAAASIAHSGPGPVRAGLAVPGCASDGALWSVARPPR